MTDDSGQKVVEMDALAAEFYSEGDKFEDFGLEGVDDGKYPQKYFQEVKPEYRLVALFKASGLKNTEVARLTNYSPAHLGQILRQPAVKRMIRDAQKNMGIALYRQRIANIADEAIDVLQSLMNSNAASDNVRADAAKYFLDQTLGKATQHVARDDQSKDYFDEQEVVQERIANVEQRLKRLGALPAGPTGPGGGEGDTP